MLSIERQELIKNKLFLNNSIPLDDLLHELGISKATLYRDINALQKQGLLTLSHGVITSTFSQKRNLPSVSPFHTRSRDEIHVLNSIAAAAVELISAYDSIFIGEGILCFLLAQRIVKHPNLRHLIVVTNNFNVALVLFSHVRHLYLIGGELLYNSENLYTGGCRFAQNLSTILVNKAFASIDGIDLHAGYTLKELSQLNILQQFPTFVNSTIFLAPSSKFGNRSIHHLAPLDFAAAIITDDRIPADIHAQYATMENTQLIVAKGQV